MEINFYSIVAKVGPLDQFKYKAILIREKVAKEGLALTRQMKANKGIENKKGILMGAPNLLIIIDSMKISKDMATFPNHAPV